MTTYYLWDKDGTMYAIGADDPKADQAERLRCGRMTPFWYGSIKMVKCLGVV